MLKKHHEKDERDLTIKQAENIPKWLKIVCFFFFEENAYTYFYAYEYGSDTRDICNSAVVN